jgi:hypothetical protein
MWKRDSYYSIPVAERMVFQEKLERVYLTYGKHIEVLTNFDFFTPNDIAYMQVDHDNGEFISAKLVCGRFWYEEDNICPIIAMTHELGHYVDLAENFNFDFPKYRSIGVFEFEVRAWEHAIKFCNDIGITDKYPHAIYAYAKTCLTGYFEGLRWEEFLNQDTFNNAMNRLMELLGLNEDIPEPEELKPKPSNPSFAEFLQSLNEARTEERAKRHQRQGNPLSWVWTWGDDEPAPKEDTRTPLERKRDMQRNRQRQIKKAMRAKKWEL